MLKRMLYHNFIKLLVLAFISMQAITLTHAVELEDEPHHDCMICEAGIVSAEIGDITPAPVTDPFDRAMEPIFYDASYKSAIINLHPGRGPPPRAPPFTQV